MGMGMGMGTGLGMDGAAMLDGRTQIIDTDKGLTVAVFGGESYVEVDLLYVYIILVYLKVHIHVCVYEDFQWEIYHEWNIEH